MNRSITRTARRLAALAVALVAVLAAGLAVATPAHAVSLSDCPDGRICLFENDGYNGSWVYTLAPPTSGTHCVTISSAFWDQTSSVYNRTNKNATLYSHACTNTADPSTTVDAGTRTWFGTWAPRHFMNDRTRAVWFSS